jgi:integrase
MTRRANHGRIFRERNDVFYIRVPKGRVDGKFRYEKLSLGTRDETRALSEAQSYLAAHEAGSGGRVLWQQLVNLYKKEHFPKLKPSTRETYRWAIVALTPFLFDKPVRKINNSIIDAFVRRRSKEGKTSACVRGELAVLSSIMRKAEGWSMIDTNPVARYLKANKVDRGNPRTRWLTVVEEARILRHLAVYAKGSHRGPHARHRLADAVMLADIGPRLDELCQMRKDEISFELNHVYLPGSRTKNGKDRWVPLFAAREGDPRAPGEGERQRVGVPQGATTRQAGRASQQLRQGAAQVRGEAALRHQAVHVARPAAHVWMPPAAGLRAVDGAREHVAGPQLDHRDRAALRLPQGGPSAARDWRKAD